MAFYPIADYYGISPVTAAARDQAVLNNILNSITQSLVLPWWLERDRDLEEWLAFPEHEPTLTIGEMR